MKSVAFIYGWSEGPWQSKKFKEQLEKEGFTITNDIYSADILVAHSAGCYLIPENNKADSIMLIGLPYWPNKSPIKSVLQNLVTGVKNHTRNTNAIWWAKKLTHNWWYILTRPVRNYKIAKNMDHAKLPKSMNVILVRNKKDTFCHPSIQNLLPKTRSYKFLELPGDHEDCWLHPDRYIELLK